MKNFFLKTGLTLLCLIIGLGSAWGETWTRVTTIKELTDGGTFIMGYEPEAKTGIIVPLRSADCNAKTTANGYFNTGTNANSTGNNTIDMSSVTSTKDYEIYITCPASGKINIQMKDSQGSFYGSSDKGSSKNTGRLYTSGNTNETNLTPEFSNESNNQFKLKSDVTGSYKYLKYNTSSPRFAFYNSEGSNIVFYKKSGTTKTLKSIVVKTPPTNTNYTEGDNFDPTGLVITATYSDDSPEDIAYADHENDFTFAPDLNTELTTSNTSVTISYEGKTVNQAISVTAFTPTAGTYTINTNNSLYGISTGNNGTEQSEVKNGITIVSGCSSNAQSKTYYDTNHIRYYKDSYLKLTAPTGYEITKVAFTASGTWYSGPNCGSNGSYNNETKTWEGNATQLNLTFSDQNRIASIEVTYAKVSTPTKTLTGITITGTPAEFWKGDTFNHNGITVTANYDDSSSEDVTNSATFSTPDMSTAGEKTVTVTYQEKTATYNINVQTIANTKETAYTVAKAVALIDAGKDLSTEVYVKGTVIKVDSYSSQYHSITYWISTDGTTTDQFQVYSGRGLDNADFSSKDDVQVGAEVIVYGIIKKFNTTYEFDKNNYLVSYSYTPPTTDFIKTPEATVKVLDAIDIKDYINGEYSSYEISTTIDGKTQKDHEFVCIYDQIRFCKAGTYVVDVTGTSGSDTQSGQVTFTVTPTGAELSSVTIGGTLTKTTYTVGDEFDFAGLTLTATCSDNSTADVTSEAEWVATPATLTEGTTKVTVTATYCGETDTKEYDVTVSAPVLGDYKITSIDDISKEDEVIITMTVSNEDGYKVYALPNDKGTSTPTVVEVTVVNGTIDSPADNLKWNISTLTDNQYIIHPNGVEENWLYCTTSNSGVRVGDNVNNRFVIDNKYLKHVANSRYIGVYNNQDFRCYTSINDNIAGQTLAFYVKAVAPKVLDHISIDGQTTSFIEGDDFSFGGTVTAHYDDESTKVVTEDAIFSGYDMSTLGTEQTVTVSYTEGGVTKTVTYDITIRAKVANKVTIIQSEGGTIHVKHNDAEIEDGDKIYEGEELTIEYEAADGYEFDYWSYKDGENNWVGNNRVTFTHTMPAAPLSLKATFQKTLTGTFTINYSVNGIIRKTETLEANASLNFPAVSSMYGKVFLGWTTSEVPYEVDDKPGMADALTATADATYYALFATRTSTGGSDELTKVDELVAGMDVILAMEEDGTPSVGISDVNIEKSTAVVSDTQSDWLKFSVNEIGDNTCLVYNNLFVTPSTSSRNMFSLSENNGTLFYINSNKHLAYMKGTDEFVLAENYDHNSEDKYYYRFYKESTINGSSSLQTYTPFFVYTDGSSTTYSAYTTLPSYVKLDEATTNGTYDKVTFGTVKIIRTLKADDTWNSLCLPFSMNEEQITEAFGEGTDVRKLTTASVTGTAPDDVLHLNFTQVTAIEAGKLYMVRVPAAISEFYVEDTEVDTAEPVQDYSKDGYTIQTHSNYNYMEGTTNGYVPVGSFVISSNKFMQVGSSTQKMKAFRGYITATDASGNPVKALGIGFIDPLTGINNVEFNTDARIYNLQGLQQSKLQKGINIVNGKKVIR